MATFFIIIRHTVCILQLDEDGYELLFWLGEKLVMS